MKNSYISAMNKIYASEDWRAKAVAAMQAEKERPAKKAIRFNGKWALAAACVVFVICLPTAITLLNNNDNLATQSSEQYSTPKARIADNEAAVANEKNAAPGVAAFGAVPDILTQDEATAILNDGLATLEGNSEAGGYDTDKLIVISVEFIAQTNTYKFTVTDKTGTELVALVQ